MQISCPGVWTAWVGNGNLSRRSRPASVSGSQRAGHEVAFPLNAQAANFVPANGCRHLERAMSSSFYSPDAAGRVQDNDFSHDTQFNLMSAQLSRHICDFTTEACGSAQPLPRKPSVASATTEEPGSTSPGGTEDEEEATQQVEPSQNISAVEHAPAASTTYQVAWCIYDAHVRGLFDTSPGSRTLCCFAQSAEFSRWFFQQPRGAVKPWCILVVDWREAKRCVGVIAAAITGCTDRLRPDRLRPELPPITGTLDEQDAVQVAVKDVVVKTRKPLSDERYKQLMCILPENSNVNVHVAPRLGQCQSLINSLLRG